MPRISQLARTAGVTPQQIRNYLDRGLLPPAERAGNGYRVLTDAHARALRTVRALAAGHGWARAQEIMRAVHSGRLGDALAAVDAGHADLTAERAEIARARAAFTAVAGTPRPRAPLRIGELGRDIGVDTPLLRQWEERGLLSPTRDSAGYRVYDASEQRIARLVAVLRRGGYPFGIIAAATAALRTDDDPARALAELAGRDRDLRLLSRARLRGSAALSDYLDSDPAPPP
ncbi:MerR family transcriptional regulator [Actinokineospora guangxiensis]|uniref:MerR family transcriptional regulator n=1 Tax=Actinokineospora guangxiensis TaxID=1490288 RepID=A0ABW0ET07_9PSEU